jgi:carbon monoxide dehydrogenase subunit G
LITGSWSYEVIELSSAQPETVYAALIDVTKWNQWVPGVKQGLLERSGDPPPYGRGAIRKFGRSGFFVREEIVAAEPPHHHSYAILSGLPVKDHLADVELQPDAHATRIEWRATFNVKIRGTGPLLERFFRRVIGGTARALAREAENRETSK